MSRRTTRLLTLTATFVLLGWPIMHAEDQITAKKSSYPPIPENVTSFGAAICGDALYVYGGHAGEAHSYSDREQGRTLWRLKLDQPSQWEKVASGPPRQGLALVAHGGKLYRIGGFCAQNKKGEPHDLHSQADVACFDPAAGKWTELPPLPEPRSSFDAAVLDGKIYVIGGWKLAGGDDEATWHKTAYVLDLGQAQPTWRELPRPPFVRRALAVAAFDGKIYAIGGMQQRGGPTTRVDIYDPASRKWSQGPSLHGEPMNGFGASAFAAGGHLYVTTMDGSVQQLGPGATAWKTIGKLERPRFFHRMLPRDDHRLLMIGGASMRSGKYDRIDILEIR